MSESKQTSSRIARRPGKASKRDRIEEILAIGEALDEQALVLVAGGYTTGTPGVVAEDSLEFLRAGYDLKANKTI